MLTMLAPELPLGIISKNKTMFFQLVENSLLLYLACDSFHHRALMHCNCMGVIVQFKGS